MEINDFDVSGSTPEPTPPPVAEAPPAEPIAAAPVEDALEPQGDPEPEVQGRDDQGKFAPKKSMQARIDRVTFEREEARREVARERAERERLAAELATFKAPKAEPVKPAPDANEPQLASFETYEDYTRAMIRYEAKLLLAAEKAAQQAERQAAESRTQVERFTAQIQAARAKYADWDDVIHAADQRIAAEVGTLPPAMRAAILSSEKATDIMRDLATHPEDAIQLARHAASVDVSAAPLMRSLLERRLVVPAASSGPAAPPVRHLAAAPIKPVGSSPVVSDAVPGDDADFDAHLAHYNRLERAGRK